jgi:hypothetical protein
MAPLTVTTSSQRGPTLSSTIDAINPISGRKANSSAATFFEKTGTIGK